MRKISLFFILAAALLLLPLEAGAGRVTPDRARRIAGNFFSLNPLTRAGSDLKMVSADDEMYMFSRQSGGFVIISGEDAAIPVLGYSFKGDISGKMPDNMVAWLDGYRKQIQALRSRRTSQDEATARLWNSLEFPTRSVGADGYEEIMNLTTADWNQGSPFNKECPEIDGKPALTGCVATAAAIVARYHRWPRHGYGTITAYSFEYKEQHYQVPARTLGREYDWDNMPNRLSSSSSQARYNPGRIQHHQAPRPQLFPEPRIPGCQDDRGRNGQGNVRMARRMLCQLRQVRFQERLHGYAFRHRRYRSPFHETRRNS